MLQNLSIYRVNIPGNFTELRGEVRGFAAPTIREKSLRNVLSVRLTLVFNITTALNKHRVRSYAESDRGAFMDYQDHPQSNRGFGYQENPIPQRQQQFE